MGNSYNDKTQGKLLIKRCDGTNYILRGFNLPLLLFPKAEKETIRVVMSVSLTIMVQRKDQTTTGLIMIPLEMLKTPTESYPICVFVTKVGSDYLRDHKTISGNA